MVQVRLEEGQGLSLLHLARVYLDPEDEPPAGRAAVLVVADHLEGRDGGSGVYWLFVLQFSSAILSFSNLGSITVIGTLIWMNDAILKPVVCS